MIDRKMNGLSPTEDKSTRFTSVIKMSKANYDKCLDSKWFTLGDDGKARLKTAGELKIDADALAKSEGCKAAKEIRDEALSSCTVEVNGNVFQARPSDAQFFEARIKVIADGSKTRWRLEDNTFKQVSKEDLIKVLSQGLLDCLAIQDIYFDTLESLL